MKIALITTDAEMIDRVKKVADRFEGVEVRVFNSLEEFLSPFSNIYRLILIDSIWGRDKTLSMIERVARLNPDGWLIALSPNVLHTYDYTDAGAKITILRNSMDLLESIIEGIVNPRTPEEVEKKYGYEE